MTDTRKAFFRVCISIALAVLLMFVVDHHPFIGLAGLLIVVLYGMVYPYTASTPPPQEDEF